MTAFDRIKRHLTKKGCEVPVPEDARADLSALQGRIEMLLRNGVRVEASPYLTSLLRLEKAR